MCGKFSQMYSWRQAVDLASLYDARANDEVVHFTPMRMVPVIHLDDDGARVVTPMTWSFTDRKASGYRLPKHMHARGETADKLPTFTEAFHVRRGVALARTFNEGEEIDVLYDDGTPAGRKWTRQWTIRQPGPRPFLMGVIFDAFDVGRGLEFEFVQITTPANAAIARITDRMPLLLDEAEMPLWLGEEKAPVASVKALIRPYANCQDWEVTVEDPTRKPPRPRNPKPKQGDLF